MDFFHVYTSKVYPKKRTGLYGNEPRTYSGINQKERKKSFIRFVLFELSQNHVRIIHMLVLLVAVYRCTQRFLCARIRITKVDFSSCCRWKARCKNYLYGKLRSVFSSLPYLFNIAYVIPSALLVPVFLMLLRVSYIGLYSFDSFSAYIHI